MFESNGDDVRSKDGCNYMNEDEIAELFEKLKPAPFDDSKIKNKILNVKYGPLPEHLIDVYKPDVCDGPLPLIFYIHGGGWSEGSKSFGFLDGVIGAVGRGYIVASVDYRLAPKTSFPEFLFDVKTSVRWARANAKEFGFDPDRFAAVGDSAGGHLALMAGFTAGRPEYAGLKYGWEQYSDEIQAIGDIYGPAVLADPFDQFFRESGVKRLRRNEPGEPNFYETAFGTTNQSLLELISPVSLVHKNIPPTLILHGLQDGVVPYQHSTILYEKIKEVCGEDRADLILYKGRNHGDQGFCTDENSETIVKFFNKHLK
jgi:acetyl esterase/lipase